MIPASAYKISKSRHLGLAAGVWRPETCRSCSRTETFLCRETGALMCWALHLVAYGLWRFSVFCSAVFLICLSWVCFRQCSGVFSGILCCLLAWDCLILSLNLVGSSVVHASARGFSDVLLMSCRGHRSCRLKYLTNISSADFGNFLREEKTSELPPHGKKEKTKTKREKTKKQKN